MGQITYLFLCFPLRCVILYLGNAVRVMMPSPFDVGLRHLRWLKHLDKLRSRFLLVREATLREDEQQRGCDEREEQGLAQTVASQLRCGHEMLDIGVRTIASVQCRMEEDGEEDAGLGVVEDPGHNHSGRYGDYDHEHQLHDHGDSADFLIKNLPWHKEERQVPQGPQG